MTATNATYDAPKPAGSAWTDDQWRAIVSGGRNVLVAAAAGSGKTAVLVERIIRKISADTDVDRLLVATFTNAAAAEMKERIRIALEQALDREPASEHLRRQLALINRASITTLHSFCLDVIRRYFSLIGLDPGFRIANETEAELLRIEVMDELFEERYAADDGGAFRGLADAFGGERGDEQLAKLVHELYDFSRSHPWPASWLRESAAAFDVRDAAELERTAWVECLKADASMAVAGAVALLEQALDAARAPGGPDAYAATIAGELEALRQLLRATESEPWSSWGARFQAAAYGFGRLKTVRGEAVDKALQAKAKERREQAKAIVAGLAQELFARTPETFAAELRAAAPHMAELAELAVRFGERYEAAKRRRGLLDFGDLEHYCLRILRTPASTPASVEPSEAALEYRRLFDEILLDEYQDTNLVQEAIVALISRPEPGNLFMVGDVKQSIYRFRLAEPNLFLAKYKAYRGAGGESNEPRAAGGQDAAAAREAAERGLRIDLARNFRSRREVVDGVNGVFRAIMREKVAEMEYDRSAELVCGAAYPEAEPDGGAYEVECVLIDRGGAASDGEEAAEHAAGDDDGASGADRLAAEAAADMQTAQLEARWIARRIRALMDGAQGARPMRVYDAKRGGYRKAAWRDIVILLRATRQWAPVLVEELQAHGIPAYAELNSGYFEATEVETMLSLLRVIDNPYQDIPLAGALRSPIFGLTADELARIRIAAGSGPYYDAVRKAADDLLLPQQTRDKLALFLERLSGWRAEARQGSLADLLWNLCRETGYYDLVGGLPGGAQRQANLRALHDRARQYEATSFRGLFRFLRFIERMRDSGGDLGTARALGEQEDVVRIMSIHKSKGLEFPFVFVAGLGKTFNLQDLNGSFLLHKRLGFGPKLIDGELRVSYPSLPHLAVRRSVRMETLAEEMRVLYVAMTRPKEKMFLVGTVSDAAKAIEQWRDAADGAGRIPDHRLAGARRFLDWLMPLAVAQREPELLPAASPGEPTGSLGWRWGVAPAAQLGVEAAAATEPDEAAEAAMRDRLQAIAALRPVDDGAADADWIDARLAWHYPHAASASVAAKTSVTEMKRVQTEAQPHAADAEPLEDALAAAAARRTERTAGGRAPLGGAYSFRLRRPRFMEEKSVTPAERGTISHLVMQYLPVQEALDEAAIGAHVRTMTEKLLLTTAQAAAVDTAAIAAFFAGPLGRRLRRAHWVKRELPFSCAVPAGRVHPAVAGDAASADEPVLIQGVVDCLFEDEDGLVLLDYKTDRIYMSDWERAAERHRFQLELYAEALGRILNRQVTESHVFFFDGGRSVRLT